MLQSWNSVQKAIIRGTCRLFYGRCFEYLKDKGVKDVMILSSVLKIIYASLKRIDMSSILPNSSSPVLHVVNCLKPRRHPHRCHSSRFASCRIVDWLVKQDHVTSTGRRQLVLGACLLQGDTSCQFLAARLTIGSVTAALPSVMNSCLFRESRN